MGPMMGPEGHEMMGPEGSDMAGSEGPEMGRPEGGEMNIDPAFGVEVMPLPEMLDLPVCSDSARAAIGDEIAKLNGDFKAGTINQDEFVDNLRDIKPDCALGPKPPKPGIPGEPVQPQAPAPGASLPPKI
jgi:hypothetical protein